MCLGRPAGLCCCDDAPVPVAVCAGCGAQTDDPDCAAHGWERDAPGPDAWCPACLAAMAREHEAGCSCSYCVDAIEQYWQDEAERAIAEEG